MYAIQDQVLPDAPYLWCPVRPYVPVQVILCDLFANRYTYVPPRCRTSHYHLTFIPLSVSLWNDLGDPLFDGMGLAGFKSRAYAFLLA